MEAVTDFIFLSSKITTDGDCSHEFKTYLLLGRKAVTNLNSVLKSRDITAEKDPYSQSCGFPVVKYGHESWTIKKAECHQKASMKLPSPAAMPGHKGQVPSMSQETGPHQTAHCKH